MFKPFLIHYRGRKCVRIEALDRDAAARANASIEKEIADGEGGASVLVYAVSEDALPLISPYYCIGAMRPEDLSDS